MKDFYYDYGYNFIKIFKDKEVPNFIKEASSLEEEEIKALPDSAFASESTRTLPITDQANVFVSAAYYYGANEKNANVEDKILKAASFFGISEEVEKLKSQLSNQTINKAASDLNIDDARWEIHFKQANGNTVNCVGDSTNIEKFANEFVANLINKCEFNEKIVVAKKIANELERFGKEIPHRILEVSGRNIPNTEKLAQQVRARAIRLSDDSDKVALCKIAENLEISTDKNIEGMFKIAEILFAIDSKNKLERFYGKSFSDPFSSVFNTTQDEAQKAASIINIGDHQYSMLEMEGLDRDIFKSALSKEACEMIGIGTESEDLSKIDNLSDQEKNTLLSYL